MSSAGAYSGTKLLLLANRARRGEAFSSFDLWRVAARSTESDSGRRTAYRHALIHAGRLVDLDTERPYASCPVCAERLDG